MTILIKLGSFGPNILEHVIAWTLNHLNPIICQQRYPNILAALAITCQIINIFGNFNATTQF
jgi:hypothetical protein